MFDFFFACCEECILLSKELASLNESSPDWDDPPRAKTVCFFGKGAREFEARDDLGIDEGAFSRGIDR